MQPSTGDQRQALDAVLERAGTDAEFRRALLADPHAAVQAAFGIVIPASFRIRFVEKGDDVDALIVLPDLRPRGRELTDDELEIVAGGAGAGAFAQQHRWKNAPPRRSL